MNEIVDAPPTSIKETLRISGTLAYSSKKDAVLEVDYRRRYR